MTDDANEIDGEADSSGTDISAEFDVGTSDDEPPTERSGGDDRTPDLDDIVLDNLGTDSDGAADDEASRGLFDDLREGEPFFEN